MAPASPASLPSVAVAGAAKILRGKRTGKIFSSKGTVSTKENGIEDLNEFWDAAKTPKADSEKTKQVNPVPAEKLTSRKPRFSLPGVNDDDDSPGDFNVSKYLSRAIATNQKKDTWSPGDLSLVSTLPPTPATHQPVEPEEVRAFAGEEEEMALPLASRLSVDSPAASLPSPQADFTTDDDDDDMVPPPPPHDDERVSDLEETQDDPQYSTADAVDFPNNTNDDDMDDDNEGPGFNMVQDPQTPDFTNEKRTQQEEKQSQEPEVEMEETIDPKKSKRGRPKSIKGKNSASSRPKSYKDADSVASTPGTKHVTKGKQIKKVYWSPVGYQSGPREYRPVPISDYKESPDLDGPRRSRRAKIPPLQFWKNERVEFGAHNESGELGNAMGCMPAATAVVQALPTPYRKRKVPLGGGFTAKNSSQREPPFDNKKLKKQLSIIDGEDAHIWDECIEDARDQKVVSYANKLTITDLPLPRTRKKSEGKIVGKAAQSFNIPSDENDQYVGYIMGNLILPPHGIKDPESTGSCSQVFTVCTGQPGSVEVAFSDPHEEEGTLNPETAQRFLLGPGDQFRVPPGNCYRLQNHSKSTNCLLAWTIIRPRRVSASP